MLPLETFHSSIEQILCNYELWSFNARLCGVNIAKRSCWMRVQEAARLHSVHTEAAREVCPSSVQFSSAQFSLTWYLRALKRLCALHPVSQGFSQRCLWNSPSVCLTDDGPPSPFKKYIVERFLFPPLSPPWYRWSDVLGFVPAVSVSSSSTLQLWSSSLLDSASALLSLLKLRFMDTLVT